MDHFFRYQDRQLHCEDVPVPALAEHYGTPVYIYSQAALIHQLRELQSAFAAAEPLICYSIKSNPNIHIARLMKDHGAGFDVTSGGELFRALQAGGTGNKIVFAGVGKTDAELKAGLDANVILFNVESAAELHALANVAQQVGKTAAVAIRVNPALPPKTHIKTDTSVKGTKFGLDIATVLEVAASVAGNAHVRIAGLHMHLGSPIMTPQPYKEGAEKGAFIIEKLRQQGHDVQYFNMGGGFGIDYRQQESIPASAFAEAILPAVQKAKCRLILEPGRFITGNSGILVSRVIYTKSSGGREFIIQDAGMNDLIRPTLYEAFHRIWPVSPMAHMPERPGDDDDEIAGTQLTDVVGPVCETGDYLAKDRPLPPMERGDLLAIFSAGAYGMSMSSNYNSRLRAAEVLVDGSRHRLIRRRETLDDLVRCEVEV
jgi:diaminopimelate decarboxylase